MTTPAQPVTPKPVSTPGAILSASAKPGHLIGITGLPGTGKSHFARSCRDVGKTAVALTDPKETTFYGAEGVEVFADLDWRPHLSQWNASAFNALLRWVDARAKDDSRFVVIDTASEISDLVMHEVLKAHGTDNPRDLEYGRAYTAHDGQFKTLVTELRRLVLRGKTVVCTFHGQMKELEGAGDAKKAKAMNGELEWSFDEQMLPAMNTSYRQRVHSAFGIWLYTKPAGFGAARKYYVTALPDNVRPAKHSVTFRPGVNAGMLENTMGALLGALVE